MCLIAVSYGSDRQIQGSGESNSAMSQIPAASSNATEIEYWNPSAHETWAHLQSCPAPTEACRELTGKHSDNQTCKRMILDATFPEGKSMLSFIVDILRKNGLFVDMYRAICRVPGTMRALVPTVFTALGATLMAVFGLSGDARSVFAPMIAQNGSIVVNTEVVLAVDVSASMTPDEQALQREGYVQALSSREFMQALKASGNGRISITYFEWANVSPTFSTGVKK
jgi:Protein of unknown function (DUF1194)